jgi:hypothetical protein
MPLLPEIILGFPRNVEGIEDGYTRYHSGRQSGTLRRHCVVLGKPARIFPTPNTTIPDDSKSFTQPSVQQHMPRRC